MLGEEIQDRIKWLRGEHQELQGLLESLLTGLSPEEVRRDTTKIVSQLAVLTQKMLLHLLQEDRLVYQELVFSGDEAQRRAAIDRLRETGRITARFRDLMRGWSSPAKMTSSPEHFCNEAKDALFTLQRRILHEENNSITHHS